MVGFSWGFPIYGQHNSWDKSHQPTIICQFSTHLPDSQNPSISDDIPMSKNRRAVPIKTSIDFHYLQFMVYPITTKSHWMKMFSWQSHSLYPMIFPLCPHETCINDERSRHLRPMDAGIGEPRSRVFHPKKSPNSTRSSEYPVVNGGSNQWSYGYSKIPYYRLVMTKIAMEIPTLNGGFTRNIIYKWAIYTMAMLVITIGP